MTNRKLLKPGDRIILSDDRANSNEWEIISLVGEGASAVCYFARSGKKQGRLKEFYPLSSISLIRDEKNQLVPSESDIEKFRKMCAEYENSFKILDKIRNENGLMLNNFIPVQESLHGVSSLYIWSPDDKHGVTFEDYLKKVRQNPNELPVKKLFMILRILATLADCVKFLHQKGVVHLDLKPSNLLVAYTSDSDVNPAHLSLFDTNSLYDLKSELPFRPLGTEGFTAPELKCDKVSNRSDIYSIGCILFYAIIVEKSVPDGLYKPYHYRILNQLVAHSELLNSGVVTGNVSLQSILIHILKKSLAHNLDNRYSNCDQLITDLFRALMILMPGISSQTDLLRDIHKKIVLVDDETPGISSPTIVIQDLLYKKPILTPEKNPQNVNIIVIGAGTFAQKFMDQALQAVQVPFIDKTRNFSDRNVIIRAYSNNPEYDRELYLATRPALPKFVNVNASLNPSDESYAQIDFLQVPSVNSSNGFSVANIEQNKKIIDEIISCAEEENEEINYIFVALGDDDLNRQIAEAFFDATQVLEMDCPVNFVVHDKSFSHKTISVNPVFVAQKILPETISSHLERMAFNTHLSYFGSLSGNDLDEVKKDFIKSRYDHESSLAFALSVKYKLIALGIPFDESNLDNAAEQFAKICDEPLMEVLAYYEHRRWVVNMISTGWQPPVTASGNLDYNYCLLMTRNTGKPQNKSEFLHPCIVHSRREHTLKKYPEKWTLPTDGLDELDKMSVELNKNLCRKADKFRGMKPLSMDDFKRIRDHVSDADNEEILFALNRLEFYLTQILNGNKYHSKNVDAYFKEFINALKSLPEYTRNTISDWLENFRKDFIVVAVANRRIDYKGYDFDIVKNIPFILTYKPQPKIILAFDDGDNNEQFFRNVASATILNPSQITYLYFVDDNLNCVSLLEKIRAVQIYFSERKIFAAINFIFVSEKLPSKNFDEKITNHLAELSLKSVDFCEKKILMQTLVALHSDFFDGSTKLFKSNYHQSLFTQEIVKCMPYFEFDVAEKNFSICRGCNYLRFISDSTFLRAVDVFKLRQASFKFNLPDDYFNYYEKLWAIYSHENGKRGDFRYGVINWNRLCKILNDYEEDPSHFECIDFQLKEKLPEEQRLTYISSGKQKVMAFLLRKLRELGVISRYQIIDDAPDFKIDIDTVFDIKKYFEKFLFSASKLLDENFCRFKINHKGDIVTAIFSDLEVKELTLGTRFQRFNINLLKSLRGEGFLNVFKINPATDEIVPKKVTFAYCSLRMKNLLLKSGMILEIYTYYKLLETGYFDDVVSNFEFTWRSEKVENELDIIVVRGFSSAIIECKAKTDEQFFSQEELFKFNDIVDRFGIASTKILISAGTLNEIQRNRATELGIIVVDNPEDIINIGETVKRIIEKKAVK
jgi:serine/threonine protein kinase